MIGRAGTTAHSAYAYVVQRPTAFVDPSGNTLQSPTAFRTLSRFSTSSTTAASTLCQFRFQCSLLGCRLGYRCDVSAPPDLKPVPANKNARKRAHSCECSCIVNGPKICDPIKIGLRSDGGGPSVQSACDAASNQLEAQLKALMSSAGIPEGRGCYTRHKVIRKIDGRNVPGNQRCPGGAGGGRLVA